MTAQVDESLVFQTVDVDSNITSNIHSMCVHVLAYLILTVAVYKVHPVD